MDKPRPTARAFSLTGSYGYRCPVHTGMNGTVVVGVGGADSAHFVIRDNFFDPASVTVKPGGKLGWENQHNNAHTATRP